MTPREFIDLRSCRVDEVAHLFLEFHGYKSYNRTATYCFGVFEDGRPVAAFTWNPPPPGASRALSSAPGGAGVLALSRMVAVPQDQRRLRHISKPLRRQMRDRIDRGRWPVLVTYSDASLGHTGHVYRCSGWQEDGCRERAYCATESGERKSSYSAGKRSRAVVVGTTQLTRWVHRACPEGAEAEWMAAHGWTRVPIPGKQWVSGSPAHHWVLTDEFHIRPQEGQK